MKELRPIRNLETPRRRPFWETRRSIEVLHRELGRNREFNQAIQEAFHEAVSGVDATSKPIFFDVVLEDKTLESYEFSAGFRPVEGVELIDAITLRTQDRTLFLQYGRTIQDGKPISIAELEIGDRKYTGREALTRLSEAFPRFYSVPIAKAA